MILQELKVEENDEPPPGSVLLRGQHLLPRVVDFGLAKLAERGGPSETATRQILGTPKYMAPEQAQARREDIGPPADVYALGVILYEMITGRTPYEGVTDVEVLRQAVEGKPVPPRMLRPDVPRNLEAICLKAMARTTTERYRTAIDFADDLRRFLEGRPTVARPLAWSGRAYRWLRRNDQIVAITVLAVIAVFVTTLATWNSYRSSQLRKDHDNVLNEQANRNRAEQERVYSRNMQDAFLAWRSGNTEAAQAALDSAKRAAGAIMDQPDFTYNYLARLVKAERLMIVCPAGSVTALTVSADGTRLASGHADGTVAVWDRATGKRLGTTKAHESDVRHIGFAVGGTLLVTAGKLRDNSSAMLGWAVAKDGAVAPAAGDLRTLSKDVYCFAIAPDGQSVFAGGRNGLLLKRRFNEPAAMVARSGEPPSAAIVALAVSHDGKRVITADGRGTVLCWTAGLKSDEVRSYEFEAEVSALAASDAALPAIGFGGGNVWLVAPMCHPLTYPAGGRVHWLATTAAGQVAHNSSAGRVLLGGAGLDLPTGDTGDVLAGVFAPDGQTLFTGSRDGVIRSWEVAHDTRARAATLMHSVLAVAVSPDGGRYYVADQRHVSRYEGKSDGFVGDGPRASVALRLQENGSLRGVVLDGRTVVVAEPTGNTSLEHFRANMPDDRTATSAALNSDGSRVAVGDDAGRIAVWSVTDKTLLGHFDTGLRRPVQRVALSADGQRVIAPTATGLGVWMLGMAEPLTTVAGDDQTVFCFLPTGERIATAGHDGVVRMWNATGRRPDAVRARRPRHRARRFAGRSDTGERQRDRGREVLGSPHRAGTHGPPAPLDPGHRGRVLSQRQTPHHRRRRSTRRLGRPRIGTLPHHWIARSRLRVPLGILGLVAASSRELNTQRLRNSGNHSVSGSPKQLILTLFPDSEWPECQSAKCGWHSGSGRIGSARKLSHNNPRLNVFPWDRGHLARSLCFGCCFAVLPPSTNTLLPAGKMPAVPGKHLTRILYARLYLSRAVARLFPISH